MVMPRYTFQVLRLIPIRETSKVDAQFVQLLARQHNRQLRLVRPQQALELEEHRHLKLQYVRVQCLGMVSSCMSLSWLVKMPVD